MKLLHVSDLHIGKRVNGFSMLEDQKYILQEIQALAVERKVDGVLLAGDLYDKPIPPAEAVTLLDGFLTHLSEQGIAVFAISGNHDSPERLSFGGRLLEKEGIHLVSLYHPGDGVLELQDAWGTVRIYLLPYLKPAVIRHLDPEQTVTEYNEAVAWALSQWDLDPKCRNVLVAHQFVVGGVTCESEERSVGGLDQVDAQLFRDFDYVALGHLHGPQKIGRETVRYAGSPLKYSFSEVSHHKSVVLVTLEEKGKVSVELLPLHPMRDMREIRGTYESVTMKSFYEGTCVEDYLHVILTDEEDVPEAVGKLRAVYPNVMQLSYDNLRTQGNQEILGAECPEEKTPLELFRDFYQLQNNQPMGEEQERFLAELMETIWEGEA